MIPPGPRPGDRRRGPGGHRRGTGGRAGAVMAWENCPSPGAARTGRGG